MLNLLSVSSRQVHIWPIVYRINIGMGSPRFVKKTWLRIDIQHLTSVEPLDRIPLTFTSCLVLASPG